MRGRGAQAGNHEEDAGATRKITKRVAGQITTKKMLGGDEEDNGGVAVTFRRGG